jgi:signal transduction histidine kinase
VGRLFWKFFAFVWLAQLAGIVAVGTLFWLTSPPPMAFARALPPPHHWPRGLPPPAALAATLTASFITALLLAWYVARPIRNLREAFDAAAAGDLNRRIAGRIGARNDELADLGRDFDRMASRLENSMQGQRRLLHDVSHEMRSPLARLQAAVGILRQQPQSAAAMIARIEDETTRIDQMVGELLTLSRLEAGEWVGEEEEVDLQELIAEVLRDANFEAQAQGRQVIWEERATAFIRGRPELLHSAIENLVRNALKHAPESPKVWLETRLDSQRYQIRVLDEGPGVAAQELANLFTPFFRGGTDSEGYGLGLALARRCVEAHGGTIQANNRPGGGLCVEIVLPLPLVEPQAGGGPS